MNNIGGYKLAQGDLLTVLVSCGSVPIVDGLPGRGYARTDDGRNYEFVTDDLLPERRIRSLAGIYRICYCRPQVAIQDEDITTPKPYSCFGQPELDENEDDDYGDHGISLHQFVAKVGLLTVRGPTGDNDFACQM
jgi:hypothetical protein